MTPTPWNPLAGPAGQGDVTLVLVPDVIGAAFAGAPPTKLELARGSTSDHSHYIDAIEVLAASPANPRRIYVPVDAVLRVEPESSVWRHPTIAVPSGVYDVFIHEEFTPAAPVQVGD